MLVFNYTIYLSLQWHYNWVWLYMFIHMDVLAWFFSGYYCFLDCQTILNFFRSLVLNSSCVSMIKSQYEGKHDYRTKMDVLLFGCPLFVINGNCLFIVLLRDFFNIQSMWFVSLSHCTIFHFFYKQSRFIIWFWSYSCIWEWTYIEFFMYSVRISLEITDYCYILSVFSHRRNDRHPPWCWALVFLVVPSNTLLHLWL